jgi:hypothetical protein
VAIDRRAGISGFTDARTRSVEAISATNAPAQTAEIAVRIVILKNMNAIPE